VIVFDIFLSATPVSVALAGVIVMLSLIVDPLICKPAPSTEIEPNFIPENVELSVISKPENVRTSDAVSADIRPEDAFNNPDKFDIVKLVEKYPVLVT